MFGGTPAAVVACWVPLLHGKDLFKYHIMQQKGGHRESDANKLSGYWENFVIKGVRGFQKFINE